jgi:hypothetical protein
MKLLERGSRFWLVAALACVVVAAIVVLTVAFGGGSPSGATSASHSPVGRIILTPRSGDTTLNPRWSTTTACPAGYQGSALLYALNSDGTVGSIIAPEVAYVRAPFGGKLLGPIGKIFSLGTNVTAGGTSKWVVRCTTGTADTGASKYMEPVYVTLSPTGSSYTTSATPPSG